MGKIPADKHIYTAAHANNEMGDKIHFFINSNSYDMPIKYIYLFQNNTNIHHFPNCLLLIKYEFHFSHALYLLI